MKFKDVDLYDDTPISALTHARAESFGATSRVDIAVHEHVEPLEAEWRALAAQNINSLHQGYDWCRAWIDAHRRPLQIVEGRIDGALAFILPLEIVQGRLFTKAEFIGALHANINTGLVSEAFLDIATPELMAVIADNIRDRITGADCVILSNMPQFWQGRALPFSMLPHIENQNHSFQLPLKATFVETLAQLNAKRRRKKYSVGHRRLEALGGYEHVFAETDADKHQLLDLFFTQKAARLAEFGLPNTFACPKTRKFLHSAATLPQTASDFPLRMHAIRMTGGEFAGEIPAVAGLSRKGNHVIVQFCSIGSGPTTEASPGELLFHLMIEQYNKEDVSIFDFGIGAMAFKSAWCPQETIQVNVNIPVTSLGRLAALKEEMTTKLKTMIKQNPAVYSFVQKLRTRVQGSGDTATEEKSGD
jgi:CelD/BcsL family acetyltransferase involved in cellulose biosynthesis